MSAPDRISLVLRAVEGGSQGDLQAELEQKANLHLRAVGVHPLLAAHAHEMLSLLRLIDAKCGGLDALLAHNIEPSEEMWQQSRDAMESIGPLLDKLAPGLADNSQPAFSIDEHVRMTADAKRYRWLRDFERVIDAGEDLVAGRGFRCFYGEQLDHQIDEEIRRSTAEQQP